MLPKKSRLKKPFQQKQYTNASPLLSFVAKDNVKAGSRLLIVASKRIGKAAVRNRLRRVLMTAFSEICYKMAKNIDIVIYPRRQLIGLGKDDVKAELSRLLREKQLYVD